MVDNVMDHYAAVTCGLQQLLSYLATSPQMDPIVTENLPRKSAKMDASVTPVTSLTNQPLLVNTTAVRKIQLHWVWLFWHITVGNEHVWPWLLLWYWANGLSHHEGSGSATTAEGHGLSHGSSATVSHSGWTVVSLSWGPGWEGYSIHYPFKISLPLIESPLQPFFQDVLGSRTDPSQTTHSWARWNCM